MLVKNGHSNLPVAVQDWASLDKEQIKKVYSKSTTGPARLQSFGQYHQNVWRVARDSYGAFCGKLVKRMRRNIYEDSVGLDTTRR